MSELLCFALLCFARAPGQQACLAGSARDLTQTDRRRSVLLFLRSRVADRPPVAARPNSARRLSPSDTRRQKSSARLSGRFAPRPGRPTHLPPPRYPQVRSGQSLPAGRPKDSFIRAGQCFPTISLRRIDGPPGASWDPASPKRAVETPSWFLLPRFPPSPLPPPSVLY